MRLASNILAETLSTSRALLTRIFLFFSKYKNKNKKATIRVVVNINQLQMLTIQYIREKKYSKCKFYLIVYYLAPNLYQTQNSNFGGPSAQLLK